MKRQKKVLITDEAHSLLIDELTKDGYEVDYHPHITADEVLQKIYDHEGLIVNSKVYVSGDMLERAVNLKFVCRAGSGLEVVDLEYAKQRGVQVFNSPEGN